MAYIFRYNPLDSDIHELTSEGRKFEICTAHQ